MMSTLDTAKNPSSAWELRTASRSSARGPWSASEGPWGTCGRCRNAHIPTATGARDAMKTPAIALVSEGCHSSIAVPMTSRGTPRAR